MPRRKSSSRFAQVIDAYEGKTVQGFSAWLRWSAQVYLALQLDALSMNIVYNLLLLFMVVLGWVVGLPVLSALGLMVWLLMPLAFMGKIRRSFIREREAAAGKKA